MGDTLRNHDADCIANGMQELVDQGWRKFAIVTQSGAATKVIDELSDYSPTLSPPDVPAGTKVPVILSTCTNRMSF